MALAFPSQTIGLAFVTAAKRPYGAMKFAPCSPPKMAALPVKTNTLRLKLQAGQDAIHDARRKGKSSRLPLL